MLVSRYTLREDGLYYIYHFYMTIWKLFLFFVLFQPTQQQLLTATSSGDIRIFNLFTGVEESSYQVHESYIYHMQVYYYRIIIFIIIVLATVSSSVYTYCYIIAKLYKLFIWIIDYVLPWCMSYITVRKNI